MEQSQSGVYAPQIIEFVTIADQYCKHIERSSQYKAPEFLSIMQRLLPVIYVKAVVVPRTEPVFEEGNERFVKEEDWNTIEGTIARKLGELNSFEEPFDQTLHGAGEPAAGSISEYLADLYQDLKDFLLQYRTGTEEVMNDAIWECTNRFETSWGKKALSTLRAIHQIYYSGTDFDAIELSADKTSPDSGKDTSSWFISKRQENYGEND
jgi:hypothetical protein